MIKRVRGRSLIIGNIQKSQDRLNFTITNVGSPEVIINGLYLQLLRYVHCPHCRSQHCMAGSRALALMLSTEYELLLNGDYSRYDLVPLTPDNARNTFIYKDGDSDLFGIDLEFSGGIAYCVKICADYCETRNQKQRHTETDEIVFFKVRGGGNSCRGSSTLSEWVNDPGRVPPQTRYCEYLKPGVYKIAITRTDQLTEFLAKFGKSALQAMESDFLNLLNNPVHIARKKAIFVLGYLGHKEYVSLLTPFLKDIHCRESAADALGDIGDAGATSALLECLANHVYGYRFKQRVLLALGKVANRSAVGAIQDYLDELDGHAKSWLEGPGTAAIEALLNKEQGVHMEDTNILAVFANPKESNPLRLEAEDRVMHECLKLARNRERLNLRVLHAATIHDVRRALLDDDYQIIQFSGHGTGQGLAFEDELGQIRLVPQESLAEFLSAYSPPINCVILNACYTDAQGQLVSKGIPYTISMTGAISDEGATEFTRGFYDAIGAGKDIEFAYQEGCRTIKLMGLPDGSNPLLFRNT